MIVMDMESSRLAVYRLVDSKINFPPGHPLLPRNLTSPKPSGCSFDDVEEQTLRLDDPFIIGGVVNLHIITEGGTRGGCVFLFQSVPYCSKNSRTPPCRHDLTGCSWIFDIIPDGL